MKCPNCSRNHKRRLGMRCVCTYQFVFDPKVDRISDRQFSTALDKASSNDTHYFTLNQVDSVLRRMRATNPRLAGVICLTAFVLFSVGFFFEWHDAFLTVTIIAFFISLLSLMIILVSNAKRLDTAALMERWKRRNGPVRKLISEPRLQQPPPEWKEPDIYSYGVERILFVERDLLVDLLVSNGFHAEERALVVSESGYPSYIEARAERMLKESPDTKVFLLHDSTKNGVGMKGRIVDKYGLQGNPPIDLGLFPKDWKRLKAAGPLGLRRDGYEAPVDMIPYSRLGGVTAAAFAAGVPLAMLPPPSRDTSGGNDGGSFG